MDNVEKRMRARLRAVMEGYPTHVACGGECVSNPGGYGYYCNGCSGPVRGQDVETFGFDLDELREWYARDVGQLLEMLEEAHR